MNLLKKTRMLLGLILIISSSITAQTDDFDKDILIFFKVSGVETTYKSAISSMMDMMSKNMNITDNEMIKELKDEMSTDENIAEILNEMRIIYKKHFSQADIKGLIKFYESPIGKKLVKEQPSLMTESMEVGQNWGRSLGEKVYKRIQEKKK